MARVPAWWSAKSTTSESFMARWVMRVECQKAAHPSFSTLVIPWGAK